MPDCGICEKSFDSSSSKIRQWTPRELSARAPIVRDMNVAAMYAMAVSVIRFNNPPGAADQPVEWICASCMKRCFTGAAKPTRRAAAESGGFEARKTSGKSRMKLVIVACLSALALLLIYFLRPSATDRDTFSELLEEMPDAAGPVEHVEVTKLQWEVQRPSDLPLGLVPSIVDVGDAPPVVPAGSRVRLIVEMEPSYGCVYLVESEGKLSSADWIDGPGSGPYRHLVLEKPGDWSWDLLLSPGRLDHSHFEKRGDASRYESEYSQAHRQGFTLRRVSLKVVPVKQATPANHPL